MAEPPSFLKDSLLGPFSAALPTWEETRLLRACVWSGAPGVQAWQKWSHEIADPAGFLRQEKDGIKGLLPLLFDSLQANGTLVDSEFRTYLRTAYLRDELRSRSYARICRNVIDAFADARIPAVLLKGAALAETCYRSPGLQHAHYLEILIRGADLTRAVELLRAHAFSCVGMASWKREGVELVHESGLPLVLHRRLFRLPLYSVNMEAIWARSQNEMLYGAPARILCSSDNLFHICGSVFDLEQHESLRWVCDAWFLLRSSPNLDWNLLSECARQSRMALPLFVTAGYLVEALNAPIPTSFVTSLQTAALKAKPIEREAALFAIQSHFRGGLSKIMRSCYDWRTRGLVLKWALLPSPDYMRGIYKVPSRFLLPLAYPYRPMKFTLRSIWFWGRRIARRLRDKFESLRAGCKVIS